MDAQCTSLTDGLGVILKMHDFRLPIMGSNGKPKGDARCVWDCQWFLLYHNVSLETVESLFGNIALNFILPTVSFGRVFFLVIFQKHYLHSIFNILSFTIFFDQKL